MSKHDIWCEKYVPTDLSEYVFHDTSHEKSFKKFITEQTIPHLLLSGVQGSGKTAMADILMSGMGLESSDMKVIDGSDENSISMVRDIVRPFVETCALGSFKIILVEEADQLSLQAQNMMRHMMQPNQTTTRFIFTCNYENKIIPALKSRFQHFRFKSSPIEDVVEYAAKVLISEHISFDLDLVDKYVHAAYPDIRKIINLMQQNCDGGILSDPSSTDEAGDYRFKLIEHLQNNDWKKARAVVCSEVTTDEWEALFTFMYKNLDQYSPFTDITIHEEGIVIIADHMNKHTLSADPEINVAAMFIRLGQLTQ